MQSWSDAGQCASLLAGALERCGAAADDRLLLVFHPDEAALVIGAADLCAAWPHLHALLWDTLWIVPRGPGRWVAEVSLIDNDLGWLPA